MAFTLPDLPYAYDALEAAIDAKTMEIHHQKHHGGYVAKLNDAVKGTKYEDMAIDELMANIASVPEDIRTKVRNNGGGHYNHSLFWTLMTPRGAGKPTGDLANAIDSAFGSFDDFKSKFADAATNRFGSGWAWLGKQNSKVVVCSTSNQDNPLMTGLVECECTPLLGLDVWEHAYYLRYQNKRPDYIESWWKIVNWDAVAERFKNAR